MKNTKIKVYTAITGNKDHKRNDILCFDSYNHFKDPLRNAKIYKILPHLFFDTDYSIWVDGNVFLNVDPLELISKMDDKEIAVIRHANRSCIYEEAKTIIEHNLDDRETVLGQINRYKKEGYKKDQGLGMCFMIIRKHTEKIAMLNEKWWAEICSGSRRDQISFPYVFHNEIKYLDWPGSYNNKIFTRPDHIVPFHIKLKSIIPNSVKSLIKNI